MGLTNKQIWIGGGVLAGGLLWWGLRAKPDPRRKAELTQVKAGSAGHPTVGVNEVDYVMVAAAQKLYTMKFFGISPGTSQAIKPDLPLVPSLAAKFWTYWRTEINHTLGWQADAPIGASPIYVAASGGGYFVLVNSQASSEQAFRALAKDANKFYDNFPASALAGTDVFTGAILGDTSRTLVSPTDATKAWNAIGRLAIALDADRHVPSYEGEIWTYALNNLKSLPAGVLNVVVQQAVKGARIVGKGAWGLIPWWVKAAVAVGGIAWGWSIVEPHVLRGE